MSALVYSSSLAAAFLGGILALFAPCCVVSLLPTFVGAALERGRMRLPITAAIFAAGIATVMLPIVLGLGLLGQLLSEHHRVVFFVVGLFLVLLALQVLSGRPWSPPIPMLRLRVSGSSPGGVYALGLTAGVASSCCAPVLAGVAAMSALSTSVPGALGLGLAYVFGMVFPLLVAVLFWDRLAPDQALRLPSLPRLHVGGRALPWSDLTAGVMFLGIGALALGIAYTGQSTYLPDWLTSWNRWATGVAGDTAVALRGVPALAQGVALAALAALIAAAVARAWRRGPVRPTRGRAQETDGDLRPASAPVGSAKPPP